WMQELDQAYGRGYGGTSGMSSNSHITIYSGGLPVLSGVVGEIGAGLLKSYTDISGIGVEFNQQTGEIMMHTTHVYSVGEWVKLGDKYWELNTTVVENVTRSLGEVLGNMDNNGSGEGNGLGNTANNINTGIGVGSGLFAGNYGMTANQIIRYAERIKGEVVSAAELTAAHTAQSMKMANALGRLNIVTGTLGSAYSTGKVISDYNSGGWQNVNGLDVADAAIGWGGVGVGVLATIGIVSNPVGWVVGIGTGIYFGARLIYDISQD
ncbi:MAG: hypothetical protein GX587_02910, partial [Bacteroidales bacterium]|nr:hypothetical protein [Bacteroidales bacterium]